MSQRLRDQKTLADSQSSPSFHPSSFHTQLRNSPIKTASKHLISPSHYHANAIPFVSQNQSLKKAENESKFRTQIIVVHCQKHSDELLKFIDTSSNIFGPNCDLCIVDPENNMGKMKLERIVDLQDKMRQFLMSNIEQLKDMEYRVDNLTREIQITNALRNPMMVIIDDMEKQVTKEVEYVFKRLREKFTRINPFGDIKANLKEKIDIFSSKVHNVDSQGYIALSTLQEVLKQENTLREEVKELKTEVDKRLSNSKNFEPAKYKEFGAAQNAFDEYSAALKQSCDKFLSSIMK